MYWNTRFNQALVWTSRSEISMLSYHLHVLISMLRAVQLPRTKHINDSYVLNGQLSEWMRVFHSCLSWTVVALLTVPTPFSEIFKVSSRIPFIYDQFLSLSGTCYYHAPGLHRKRTRKHDMQTFSSGVEWTRMELGLVFHRSQTFFGLDSSLYLWEIDDDITSHCCVLILEQVHPLTQE